MYLHYKAKWLMLCGEVITVYSENHVESITKLCKNAEYGMLKACGTCSDHCPIRG
jgi:hypothetical protein